LGGLAGGLARRFIKLIIARLAWHVKLVMARLVAGKG
jgi:hypothetical protein